VSGGVAGGATKYQVSDGCSGSYTIYDRAGVQAFGQVEWEQPVQGETVAWLGGRGGYVHEAGTIRHGSDSTAETLTNVTAWSVYGQGWAELENPYYSVGLGLVGYQGRVEETTDGVRSWSTKPGVRPGGHLRFGFSFLGLDAGYNARTTPFGFPGARVGISGGVWSTEVPGRHPDDVRFRYFVGAQSFTSGIYSRDRFGGAVSLEFHLPERHVVGADLLVVDGGVVAGARYAIALGDERRW
jgi:hypothetical protein